jgi:hypothetical protein
LIYGRRGSSRIHPSTPKRRKRHDTTKGSQ